MSNGLFEGANPKLTMWFGIMTGLAVMAIAAFIVLAGR